MLQASPVSSDLFFSAEDTTGGQDKCQIVNIPVNRWKLKDKMWHNHTSHCGQVQMQCGILLAPPSASNPPPHFLPPRTWIDTRREEWLGLNILRLPILVPIGPVEDDAPDHLPPIPLHHLHHNALDPISKRKVRSQPFEESFSNTD